MNILITICVRGGSKGIPGKNIMKLGSKSLLEYTYIVAQQFMLKFPDADLAFSTDSNEIIAVAREIGIIVEYIRPNELATDNAGKIPVIDHILKHFETINNKIYDFILDLDVTSPLRNINDLLEAFDIILKDKEAYNIFSVNPSNRNPYFNMVEKSNVTRYYHVSKIPENPILSRQTAPKVYDLNASFYFYRRNFFELGFKSAMTNKSLIYEMNHICFDLDHKIDFLFLEYLIQNNKIDFDWI